MYKYLVDYKCVQKQYNHEGTVTLIVNHFKNPCIIIKTDFHIEVDNILFIADSYHFYNEEQQRDHEYLYTYNCVDIISPTHQIDPKTNIKIDITWRC